MLRWFQWRDPTNPIQWTPEDHEDYDQWLDQVVANAEANPENFHPVVKELQDLIDSNTRLNQLAQGMYDELSLRPQPRGKKVPYCTDVEDHKEMLRILNCLLAVPILWSSYRYLVGWTSCPILSLFWRPLHTTCGFAFFQDPEVHLTMKKILDQWGNFLKSTDSAWCLDDGPQCWFSPEALKHLISEANVSNERRFDTFEDIYICNASKPRYGFNSWDDFFTRHFRQGIRPLASPDDDNIIVHACESTPRTVQHKVPHAAKFWAKGTPYSLRDMLGHDNLSTHFVSGTVYQAYLSALSYHRWHAPVSGTIIKVALIPGFYFSEPPYDGFNPKDSLNDHEKLTWSNSYQTAVATRALIFMQADSPDIGLMAVLFVGMTEVSTCEIGVKEAQRVRKGDEIGSFHCGGSTYCLLFREPVALLDLPDPAQETRIHPVRSYLVRAGSKNSIQ